MFFLLWGLVLSWGVLCVLVFWRVEVRGKGGSFDFVFCFGTCVEFVGALCFGLCFGFWRGCVVLLVIWVLARLIWQAG